jgi:DNA-binding beta-propeller fold protein YncE
MPPDCRLLVRLFTFLLVGLALPGPARAAELAFITAQSPLDALLVYDVATMTERARVTGFGIEPSRMVANSDRSRLYLVSRINASGSQPAEMRVHIVSPAQRRILRTAVVGEASGRAIAISPDGTRLYVWKLVSATQRFGVAVLDAGSLAEIGDVPLSWTLCRTDPRDLVTAPDGRLIASGCADGLRVIDPATLAATNFVLDTDLFNDVVGIAPNGQEVYMRRTGSGASTGNALIAAIDLATGARTNLAFALPVGSEVPSGVPRRMVRVRRPADPVTDPTVFITYASLTGGGPPPIASTPVSELTPPNRRLTRLTSLGTPSASIMGVSEDGSVGVLANSSLLRRVNLDPGPLAVIAAEGDTVELVASGTPLNLSDIVVAQPLLEDGFEPE